MNFEYNDKNSTWKRSADNSHIRKWFQPKYRKTMITLTTLGAAVLICLIAFVCFGKNEQIPIEKNIETLKLTSIIFRHGARTPTGSYSTDPHKDYNWPGGLGALTNKGKLQLYNLGKTIRKRYNGYLPVDYSDDDIYIKSSDKSRTLMSAYTFLAGLYPPTLTQTWNSDITWQPIPVHALPRELDSMLAAKKNCSLFDKHLLNVPNSSLYQNITKNFPEIYEKLSLYTNDTINTPLKIELLYNVLLVQRDESLILPEWTKNLFFLDTLKNISAYSLALNTFDDFMIRIKGGPLLSEIFHNMKKIQSNVLKPNRKMFIYSAHDLTIINLWRALSFREDFLPDYGATLIVELHSVPKLTDFEVKLFFYDNTTVVEPRQLEMPTCHSPCMLSKFEEVSQKYIPIDWEKECEN